MFLFLGKIFAILLPFIIGVIVGRVTKSTKVEPDTLKEYDSQYVKILTYNDKAFWVLSEFYDSTFFKKHSDIIKSDIIQLYGASNKIESYNVLVTLSDMPIKTTTKYATYEMHFHKLRFEDTVP